jgi:cell fate regulator YaaT (PSP1 superfamily)
MIVLPEDEYLVSFGRAGDFGRFRAPPACNFRRGDRVVVRQDDGLEVGTILCPVQPGHTRYLARTAVGRIVRSLNADDEIALETSTERGHRLFNEARRLVEELDLPLEVVDVEIAFDGRRAVVHHLRRVECDVRPLVRALAQTCDLEILLQNLSLPEALDDDPGCGRPDCGKGSGGCTSCGTGGCSTCSQGTKKEDVAAYLTRLRDGMERGPRTSLL